MHGKYSAPAGLTVRSNPTAMGLHDPFGDPETESQALRVRLRRRPLETIENAFTIFGRDSNSVVPHRYDSQPFVDRYHYANWSAPAVLYGVRNDVGHGLVDPKAIPDARRRAVNANQDRNIRMQLSEPVCHLFYQFTEIERFKFQFELACANPRDSEQVVDQ